MKKYAEGESLGCSPTRENVLNCDWDLCLLNKNKLWESHQVFCFCLCGDPRPLNSCCQASTDRSGNPQLPQGTAGVHLKLPPKSTFGQPFSRFTMTGLIDSWSRDPELGSSLYYINPLWLSKKKQYLSLQRC